MSSPTPPGASGSSAPEVSVVVCAHTLDRWDDIERGMAGLAAQTRPPREVILVIDHNEELLAAARSSFPQVRVVPNSRRAGASGARNTGIALATGDVVAFLDDDARPEPDWLEVLTAPYADSAVLAVGGFARPVWPDRRPDQLVPELDWLVGCTYRGQPTELSEIRNLWGCNMSVRRHVFDEVGGFDENAGRVGLIPLGCEETEFCIRMTQRLPGSRILFEPRAVVHHRVTEARTTWAYLRSRSHAEGVSKAAMAALVGPGDATSVESDYVRTVLSRAVLREVGRGLRGQAAGWRGAAGILTALTLTAWGYLRGRGGARTRVSRSATDRRDAA